MGMGMGTGTEKPSESTHGPNLNCPEPVFSAMLPESLPSNRCPDSMETSATRDFMTNESRRRTDEVLARLLQLRDSL